MNTSWNKGLTKYTHPSIMMTSVKMKAKAVDNLFSWREMAKKQGKMRSVYPILKRDGDLAELIGVILGDGHLRKYPRTDELSIFSNSTNEGIVRRYSGLVERIFDMKPAETIHSGKKCIRIRIYQKFLQERIQIPYSPRGKLDIVVPDWILGDISFIVRYLRGLYEAEGSYSVHLPTSTYKLFFSNRNMSMLSNVKILLEKLGFHPHLSKDKVQVSRKEEVVKLLELIEFRKY
ncbi:MAG: LAGLIDADG family homing endonuclease [Candidatus Taylorbacteria bacterium]